MNFDEWIDSEIERRSEVTYQHYLKEKAQREKAQREKAQREKAQRKIDDDFTLDRILTSSMPSDAIDSMMTFERRYKGNSEVNVKEHIAKKLYIAEAEEMGNSDWLHLLFRAKKYDEINAEMQHLIDQTEQVTSKTAKAEIDVQCKLAEMDPILKKLAKAREEWLYSKQARDQLLEEYKECCKESMIGDANEKLASSQEEGYWENQIEDLCL